MPCRAAYRTIASCCSCSETPRSPCLAVETLYATGNYSLPKLVEEMYRKGLRTRRGGKVLLTGMSTVLNNPFYMGVIRIRSTGEHFAGAHDPIVEKRVFDMVQLILRGKTVVRTHRHEFAFSRMIRCTICGTTAMAEVQKGHTYYRCHTKGCATKSLRAETIDVRSNRRLSRLFPTSFLTLATFVRRNFFQT